MRNYFLYKILLAFELKLFALIEQPLPLLGSPYSRKINAELPQAPDAIHMPCGNFWCFSEYFIFATIATATTTVALNKFSLKLFQQKLLLLLQTSSSMCVCATIIMHIRRATPPYTRNRRQLCATYVRTLIARSQNTQQPLRLHFENSPLRLVAFNLQYVCAFSSNQPVVCQHRAAPSVFVCQKMPLCRQPQKLVK